jgi:hypothetical protein
MTTPGRQLDKDVEFGQQKPASAGFLLPEKPLF